MTETTTMTSSRRDGGYGWVIVAAFFLSSMIVDGIRFSFGVLFVELLNEFHSGKGETALIGSIVVGVYNLCGPIFAVLVIKLGCRKASFLGSGITCVGFICSFFAKHLFHLYFTYGIFLGFGYGLLYLAGTVSIGRYFFKKRAMAIGIANCGTGFGQFGFTPLFNLIIAEYTWRGAMLICAGLTLNCCVCGSFYRPFVEVSTMDVEMTIENPKEDNDGDDSGDGDEQVTPMLKHKSNGVIRNGSVKVNGVENNVTNHVANNGSNDLSIKRDKRFEKVNVKNGFKTSKQLSPVRTFAQMREEQLNAHRNNSSRSHIGSSRSLNLSVLSQTLLGSNASFEHIISRRGRHAHETSKLSLKATSVTDITDIAEDDDQSNYFKISIIESLFPKRLVTNINFNLMMVTSFLYAISSFIPYSILPDYAIHNGIPQSQSVWLISAMGIGGMISRLVLGYLTDIPSVHSLSLFGACLLMCGVSTLLVPLLNSFPLLIGYAFTFGFSFGGIYVVQPCLMLEYFGEEYIAEILGVLMFVMGLAILVGSPTAGWIFDVTKDYNISVTFAGAIFVIAGLTNFFVLCTKPSRESRKANKIKSDQAKKGKEANSV